MGIDILNSALTPSVSLCSSFSLHLPWFFFLLNWPLSCIKLLHHIFTQSHSRRGRKGSADLPWLALREAFNPFIFLSQKPRVLLFCPPLPFFPLICLSPFQMPTWIVMPAPGAVMGAPTNDQLTLCRGQAVCWRLSSRNKLIPAPFPQSGPL